MKLLVTRRMTQAAEHAIVRRGSKRPSLDRATGCEAEAAAAMAEYDAMMPTLGDRFRPAPFRATCAASFWRISARASTISTWMPPPAPGSWVTTPRRRDRGHRRYRADADPDDRAPRRRGRAWLLRRGEWTGWQPTQPGAACLGLHGRHHRHGPDRQRPSPGAAISALACRSCFTTARSCSSLDFSGPAGRRIWMSC